MHKPGGGIEVAPGDEPLVLMIDCDKAVLTCQKRHLHLPDSLATVASSLFSHPFHIHAVECACVHVFRLNCCRRYIGQDEEEGDLL
jgi:hypothetical protein